MCRKPLLRAVDGLLSVNQGIANAIRQRAATARLLEAVNHSGFRPLAAHWAAKTAASAVAASSCADATARALSKVPPEALFQAGVAKAFSLGTPYDLMGASQLFAVAAARGHVSAAAHLAYLQVTHMMVGVLSALPRPPARCPRAVPRLRARPKRRRGIAVRACWAQQRTGHDSPARSDLRSRYSRRSVR